MRPTASAPQHVYVLEHLRFLQMHVYRVICHCPIRRMLPSLAAPSTHTSSERSYHVYANVHNLPHRKILYFIKQK